MTAFHLWWVCNFITRHDKVPKKSKTNMFQHKEISTAGQEDYESKVYFKNMQEWLMRKLSHVGPWDHGPFASTSKAVWHSAQAASQTSPHRNFGVHPFLCCEKLFCCRPNVKGKCDAFTVHIRLSTHRRVEPWTWSTLLNFSALYITNPCVLNIHSCYFFLCQAQLKYISMDLPKYLLILGWVLCLLLYCNIETALNRRQKAKTLGNRIVIIVVNIA